MTGADPDSAVDRMASLALGSTGAHYSSPTSYAFLYVYAYFYAIFQECKKNKKSLQCEINWSLDQ